MPSPPSLAVFWRILDRLPDTRRPQILKFYREHTDRLLEAKGSKSKHQAWTGGYADHMVECLRIAAVTYAGLDTIRAVPFSLGSAQVVLLFHDIEKLFVYSPPILTDFDKTEFLYTVLARDYGISFTPAEVNALTYVHGEVADYDPHVRRCGRLGAFVHSCDFLSARMWWDKPAQPALPIKAPTDGLTFATDV